MKQEPDQKLIVPPSAPLTCGLVMPISAIDGLSAEHWAEIKTILQDSVESIESPKFVARLVSDADDVGVIQKRIVQGVYNSDIVICDVSAKNSNVMFELGMRLAFDKPTIIIKDDKTDYSFDTSVIEHIPYPRDLRFSKIIAFKRQLADKVLATHKAATSDPLHSTFLKNFGTFKVAQLNQTEGSGEQLIMETLQDIQLEMSRLRRSNAIRPSIRTDRAEEGKVKLVSILTKLMLKDPSFVAEATEELAESLEKSLPAPTFFDSPKEFRQTLDEVCKLLEQGAT